MRQGPVIVSSAGHPTIWQRKLAHPSREAVSIFRDISQSSAKENRVSFTIYLAPEFRSTDRIETLVTRKLQPDEVLFVKGPCIMDISVPSSGLLIWQGHKGSTMGTDMLLPQVFPFMKI